MLSRNFELSNIRLILKISRNILNKVSQKLTKDFLNFNFRKLRNFISFRVVKLRKLRNETNIAVTYSFRLSYCDNRPKPSVSWRVLLRRFLQRIETSWLIFSFYSVLSIDELSWRYDTQHNDTQQVAFTIKGLCGT